MEENATFAAGCFWGVQQEFDATPGVLATEVGYTGGKTEKPTYTEVCSLDTGHAEAVRITYDPAVVDYETLVRKFFELHDPTQLNRQGPDVGEQYRSAVFPHSDSQAEVAARVIKDLNESGKYARSIATKIEPVAPWWKAEDYHQKYFQKNAGH